MRITVIVPCYNGEKYLKESLNSCLNQTYENMEVIFVDNESTDNSLQEAIEIKEKYSSLVIDTAPNLYKYSAREPVEKALTLASGDYFTIVGADDVITKDYISNVVDKIKLNNNDCLCIQSGIRRVFPDGNFDHVIHQYNNIEEFKSKLLNYCCVNTPTVFYKKKLYEDGLLDWKSDEYLGAEDYDVYCQLADKGIMVSVCNEWLGYFYRIHEDQCTWKMVEESRKGNNFDHRIKSFWSSKWEKRIGND